MHVLIHLNNSATIMNTYLNMRYSRDVFVKEYLQRGGPAPVSQAGQRLFSGQDAPLRPFLPSTSPADPTCSLVLDRAADPAAGGKSPTSLFTACPRLGRRNKRRSLTATNTCSQKNVVNYTESFLFF